MSTYWSFTIFTTRNMDNNFQLIRNISAGDSGWTAKVVVAEKGSPKTFRKGSGKYQKIVLMDLEGTTVQATLYDQHISAYKDELILGKTYLVSNALVKFAKSEYSSKLNEMDWTISGKTRVQEIKEDHEALLMSTYNFTDFQELEKYMDSNTDISIIGVVIDMRPKRLIQTRFGTQSLVQDLVLIDKKFEIVFLTMWENFVDNECNYIFENLMKQPVIIAKHLKVSSFNGLSLSTKANTSFFIDPSFQMVHDFKSWVQTNVDKVNHIILDKTYLKLTPSKLSPPKEDKFTELKDIQQLQFVQRFFWVKAKSSIKKVPQSFWYMSCNNCNKESYANFGDVYPCRYCKCPDASAIPRAMAYFNLEDSTGSINATAIGEPAEKFLLCTAHNLMEHTLSAVETNVIDFVRTTIEDDKIFYIKAVQREPNSTQYRYDVMFMLDPISSVIDEKNEVNDKRKDHLSSCSSNEEIPAPPTAKRSLLQSLEAVAPTKKKIEKRSDGTKSTS